MQSIFRRYENKYLVTKEQGTAVQNILSWNMAPDRYGEYLVQNLYYDTVNWDVIKASIEKPLYKEKMPAVRSGETVFPILVDASGIRRIHE